MPCIPGAIGGAVAPDSRPKLVTYRRSEAYDGYSICVGDDEVGDWLELIE